MPYDRLRVELFQEILELVSEHINLWEIERCTSYTIHAHFPVERKEDLAAQIVKFVLPIVVADEKASA